MQSRLLDIEPTPMTFSGGAVERLSWLDKVPMSMGFGCLLGLSSPGFDIWWLAWLGLAPLLVLLRGAGGKLQAASIGLAFGFGYQLVSLRWLLGLYPLHWMGLGDLLGFQAAVFAWLIEALHQALLIAAFSLFVYALPMRSGWLPFYNRPFFPYLLSVPCIWLFFQWMVAPCDAFLGVPINQLAYSQAGQLDLIQIARWGGSQLVDFLLLLSNTTVAAAIIEWSGLVSKFEGRVDRISSAGGAAVDCAITIAAVTAAVLLGHWQLFNCDANPVPPSPIAAAMSPAIPVAVLQGNISIEEERLGSLTAPEVCKRYMTLGQNVGAPLLVLPEGVLNASQRGPMLLMSQLQSLVQQQKKQVIAGSTESRDDEAINAARLISPTLSRENFYVKRRLVPFGEYLPSGPLGALIPQPVKNLLLGRQGFVPSSSLSLISSMWGKIGASICVEVIYPHLIADEVRHGASLLVNVSNLAWFHDSVLSRQILAAAVFRAVENGRYLVLATNTGISAVIDPCGVVTSESLPGKKGIVLDRVQFLYNKTPFTRMWWL